MKKIYYWSPYIGNIATIKAVVNSAHSISKFSKGKFEPTVINSCGEWDNFEKELIEKNIKILKLKSFFKLNTKINGFIASRLAYIKIFISSFFKLKKTILRDKPDFLIAHLITSLPIFLFLIFKFEKKLIIKISGKVKMNFIRKILWKITSKKIFLITCPTKESKIDLIKLNIFDEKKIIYLPDPIIDINYIMRKKNVSNPEHKKYFLSIGRFTKQKNHALVIECFQRITKKFPDLKLLIVGEGELEKIM